MFFQIVNHLESFLLLLRYKQKAGVELLPFVTPLQI